MAQRNGVFIKWALTVLAGLVLAGASWGAAELVSQGKVTAAIVSEHEAISTRFGRMEQTLIRLEGKVDRMIERGGRMIERGRGDTR